MKKPDHGRAHFDRAAWWYDRLARLVFGTAIRDLERSLISQMNPTRNITWIGGGTGEVLPEILAQYPHVTVEYVELSGEMRERASLRLDQVSSGKIRFWESFQDLQEQTPEMENLLLSCVMDMYSQEELEKVLSQWSKSFPNIFVVEFIFPRSGPGKWLARGIIPLMYRFFNLTIGIPVIQLPDWQAALMQLGYEEHWNQTAWLGMIKAAVWKPSAV